VANSQTSQVIDHLRKAVLGGGQANLSDGQLLERFVSHRDEAAVAALVRRHGPMVWGVCRRVLRNHHDAEDAFQATFLVFVRKAASIVPRQMVANWLYGVAHQTALKARVTMAKRQVREKQVNEMPEPEARTEPDLWRDLQPLLDQELARLPDKYRIVLALCDLDGKSRKEAACHLEIPEGTLSSRLTTARKMLAKRLAQHGLAVSGGALAAVLAQQMASAGVPTSVVSSTVKTASLFAAGKAAAAGVVSPRVAALTAGVMKAMLFTKFKAAIAVVLALGFVATVTTILTCRMAAGQADKPPIAEKPVGPAAKQEKDEEIVTAWGKEVGGVQAGLGYRPGQRRAYHTGETVRLVVRVRNVGKEEVKFSYLNEFFYENPPAVTDGEGKPVPLEGAGLLGEPVLVEVNLAAGKEVKLCELNLELRPATEKGKERPVWTLYGTGKFQIQYERVGGNIGAGEIKLDPILSKLATGKLELEVKDGDKLPETRDKEGFTAWGKEVRGLQAGLGFRPGEHRAYHHGETVTLVVRVRNVGKEAVKFQYLRQFFIEKPPAVTDGEGKPVPLDGVTAYGIHIPVKVNLAPGKEIELYEWKPELKPASDRDDEKPNLSTLYGTGKFQIQYERVVGDSSSGFLNKPDPSLSKLATGKLELEVKDDEKLPEKKEEKEGFTAWGKEVGGLQAGLGFRPGQKRAYSHGETVKLVVRVRNVGKEAVKFEYLKQFFMEMPPAVTDGEGKPVPQLRYEVSGEVHLPVEVSLAPGKEIELYEWTPELKPGNKVVADTLWASGKVSIQYERILGNTGAGQIKLDPILSKLATGKLELEIKSDPPPAASEFPAGWGGGGGKDYELSVDKTVRHGGKASGSIKSLAATPLWYGALTQAFKAAKFRGQRLRMTAFVKCKEVEGSAGLWMRIEGIDGKGNYSLSSDCMGDRPIKGTNDWKQYEVVLDVPKEGTAQIYFGVLLAGKGQVWVDDFKFEAVGNAVKTTGTAGAPVKRAVELAKGLPEAPKNLDFEQ
jgi:RNA polymerase sigma factor (sigma-70 family)